MRLALAGFGMVAIVASAMASAQQARRGVALGELTWHDAEAALTPASVVVIPLGGATVQHGPHLKLDNNERLARYLAQRVKDSTDVVVAPPLTYHFYPAFLEYPGSTSLSSNTARDMTVEIVRTLAKYGPRRFYVLNTGTTTMFPLKAASVTLADDGLLLGYTDMAYRLANAHVERQQTRPRGAPHADEIETSMMLFVDPSAVDMRKAVREYGTGTGPMTRQKDAPGTFSESGVAGDATLATRQKGEALVQAIVSGVLDDIDAIREARLPIAKARTVTPPPAPAALPPARPTATAPGEPKSANGCTAGEERDIRRVGDAFSSHWRNMDAIELSKLFNDFGDMRHPDGTIERGRELIRFNRAELFRRNEYRGSVHSVLLADIRCLGGGVAMADGRWELRLEDSPTSGAPARNLGPGRRHSGYCTLVLLKGGDSWLIQAWRYTVNPPDGTAPPTTLKQPGFIGRGGH
jgi:creatinine amidohydrolase